MKIQVITISSRDPTEPYYFKRQFTESTKRQGIIPHFLREGPWLGLMTKPKHLIKYLDREGSAFEHVCVVDCWDLIWLADLDEVIRKYECFHAPMVFNCERACFPKPELSSRFPTSSTPYRFLNSGFFLGVTECVLEMLRSMNLQEIPDDVLPDGTVVNTNDQLVYQEWFLANQDKIDLDYEGALCQSLHESGPDEFTWDPEIKRVRSKLTGRYPCTVHGNGSGKDWLKKIIGWMKL